MTSPDAGLGEFSDGLFARRRGQMDSTTERRLVSLQDSGWEATFGTFVVLDALRADDLRPDEVLTAMRFAEQGQYAESSAHVLNKLLAAVLDR